MKKEKKSHLDFTVDNLTNSIENTISGDSFQTEISTFTTKDLKQSAKKLAGNLTGNRSLQITAEKFTN